MKVLRHCHPVYVFYMTTKVFFFEVLLNSYLKKYYHQICLQVILKICTSDVKC